MTAGREPERGVLGQQALVSGKPDECELLVGMIQGELELAPAAAVARLGGLGRQPKADLPEQLAPRQPESVTAADPHEGFDGCAFELRRRAPDEITDALERAMLFALENGRRGGLFAPVSHKSQSNPHRSSLPAPCSLHSAPDIAHVDVGQAYFDAVAHRVAAQRVDRVEAHRLIIEERDVVLDRVIVPEPRRLVCEQSERRGVRLGKSELAERDHLTEHLLGRGFGDTAGESTCAKLLPEAGHEIARAAAAHRAAQGFRLTRREAGERLADLQYLILIQNHSQRFREAFAEQGMIDGRLVRLAGGVRAALLLAPAHVRIDRAADDRPRADDRDFDREVFEIAWPAPPDHLDLRAALDLKQANRVTGADAIVDRGILEVDAREIGWCSSAARDQL